MLYILVNGVCSLGLSWKEEDGSRIHSLHPKRDTVQEKWETSMNSFITCVIGYNNGLNGNVPSVIGHEGVPFLNSMVSQVRVYRALKQGLYYKWGLRGYYIAPLSVSSFSDLYSKTRKKVESVKRIRTNQSY
jgi:hypothetical protein